MKSSLLLLLVIALHAPATRAGDYALQLPGEFHGDEVVARDGEEWFALVLDGGRVQLEPVTLRVEAMQDALVDVQDERSGRRVSVPALRDEPLALLRGAALRTGTPIASVPSIPADPLQPGVMTDLHAPGLPLLQLELRCEEPHPTSDAPFPCALLAIDQRGTQTLHVFEASRDTDGQLWLGDAGGVSIRYAGDLDRDGRLDLILDLSDHYNIYHPTLFLSGEAKTGELLRPAAIYEITGC